MASITKPNTFSSGSVISSSQVNENFDEIYDEFNGSISNANLSASAAIADTKLATISTAGKVNITALVATSQAQGDVLYASSGSAISRLGAGTAGQALTTGGAAANPAWGGMTTQGDVEYHNGTTRTRLAPSTAGKFLKCTGPASNPEWNYPLECISSTYTGNGADDRAITINFLDTTKTPAMVMVKNIAGAIPYWKATGHAAGKSTDTYNNADADDYIQALSANTFQVGTAANTNEATFVFVAWG